MFFFWPVYSKICPQSRKFGRNRFFTVLWSSSEIQLGRPKKTDEKICDMPNVKIVTYLLCWNFFLHSIFWIFCFGSPTLCRVFHVSDVCEPAFSFIETGKPCFR